jgi:hypothetical protein
VHVPVKAMGKKSSNVFLFPKLALSLTCFGASAVLVDNVKSGALVPTVTGMIDPPKVELILRMRIQYRIDV